MRRSPPALVPLLALTSLACDPQEPVVVMEAHPAALALVSGQPLYVALQVSPRCETLSRPVVQQADGRPVPSWLATRAERKVSEGDYLGNPGEGPPFPAGTALVCRAMDYPRDTLRYDGWQLRLEAQPPTAAAPVHLTVRVTGCGREWATDLALGAVAGTAPTTFCGYTTGAACLADDDCVRAGWYWQVCTGRDLATWPAGETCYDSACYAKDNAPATCGCTAGACAWR